MSKLTVIGTDDAASILNKLGIPATGVMITFVAAILRQQRVVLVQLSPGDYAALVSDKKRLTLEDK